MWYAVWRVDGVIGHGEGGRRRRWEGGLVVVVVVILDLVGGECKHGRIKYRQVLVLSIHTVGRCHGCR